ncbi:MAG: M4 family metallopeptidase [Saprospiraceae bacterium]|nr:M4 family metallopeptidase [Saprospiraceae bacterium]
MKNFLLSICLLIGVHYGAIGQRSLDDKSPKISDASPRKSIPKLHAPWIQERAITREKHRLTRSSVQASQFTAIQRERAKVKRIWIEDKQSPNRRDKPSTLPEFISDWKEELPLRSTEQELIQVDMEETADGWQRYRMEQYVQGLPVFGGELMVHRQNGRFVRMNGQLYRTPHSIPEGVLTEESARSIVTSSLRSSTFELDRSSLVMRVLAENEFSREVVFMDEEGTAHRAWHIKYIPNHTQNWEYLVDAADGNILKRWNNICTLHGNHSSANAPAMEDRPIAPPTTGQANDLNGNTQQVAIFDDGGTYFLFDASRTMFKSLGTADAPPVGAILTYDTKNQPIGNDGFYPNELVSSNNPNSWDPKAISAHANAGFVYEYFRQIFDRNSINGAGGSIYSFINVVNPENGEDFDNAFWNEKIMFYGNGNFQFNRPLQAAVDVAAHEVSHGVIQNSAGLIYQDESGAINESIADFFGAAAEARNTGQLDWRIGNNVANPSFFRSGTMRNMADPNNGGQSLNDPGYQPQFYSQRYTGRQDNGGVHINSGIPNHAFYLVSESVGLEKAEKIVYRTLTTYLTRSSVFADLRKGMLASAADLYGANSNEVTRVAEAFDFVEIADGPGSSAPVEAEVNPGLDLLVATYTLQEQMDLFQVTETVNEVASPWIGEEPLKPPTLTDDGTIMVYVTQENKLKFATIDYSTGLPTIDLLSENPIWRNVEISRDGTKIAALTTDNDNTVWVFDLVNDRSKQFELSNPTFTEGVSTGNVQFADALDFDFSGELLMYDASNLITAAGGEQYTYWDIGFLEVYDNEIQDFAEGNIFKLVSGLPDNVSIGNPVFSKNSPNIIALDYIETVPDEFFGGTNEEYSILGVNVETGDAQLLHEISAFGGTLGFPSFSKNDDILVFDARGEDMFGTISVVKAIFLGPDKISKAAQTDAITILEYYYWPVWFSNGQRELNTTSVYTTTEESLDLVASPNPTNAQLLFEITLQQPDEMQLQVYDLMGKRMLRQEIPGQQGRTAYSIEGVESLPSGTYLVDVIIGSERVGFKFQKQN